MYSRDAALALQKMFERMMERTSWHHSAWDRRVVVWSVEDRVVFDTCFSRYTETGELIGVYESVYIVTRDDSGHWGVKFRNSTA